MKPAGYESERLNATFAALADPTRRAILFRLTSGDASVNELAQPFALSQPAISKHLKVLERAGLISRARAAQRRPCRLEAAPLGVAHGWLDGYRAFWEQNFQRLDGLLAEMKANAARRARAKRSRFGRDDVRTAAPARAGRAAPVGRGPKGAPRNRSRS